MRKVFMIIAMALFTVGMSANVVKEDISSVEVENVVSVEAMETLELSSSIATQSLISMNNAELFSFSESVFGSGGCSVSGGGYTTTVTYGGGIGTVRVRDDSTGSVTKWTTTEYAARVMCDAPQQ